ncbi:MAG: hypothetical protein U1F33_11185 [Alphaproteobacteria bacterium]
MSQTKNRLLSAGLNFRRSVTARLFPVLLACLGASSATFAQDLGKSGTVQIEQVQLAFIGSGNLGGGRLQYQGNTYKFTVGGLGIGGFGVSKITATGTVYNLADLRDFPGAYIQGRYGAVVGDASTGKLWLKNNNGVVIELEAQRKGLALSLGGDAVYIGFD